MESVGVLDEGSQVFWCQPRYLGQSRKHAWTDFVAIVKGKNRVRPTIALKDTVRSGLAFDAPSRYGAARQERVSLVSPASGSRRDKGHVQKFSRNGLAML